MSMRADKYGDTPPSGYASRAGSRPGHTEIVKLLSEYLATKFVKE